MLMPLLVFATMGITQSDLATRRLASPFVLRIEASGALYDMLANDIRRMNAAGRGIFNEDVSAIVAPFFPPGTTFSDMSELVRRQALKPLTPFLGRKPSPADAMYVTTFDMTRTTFSSVYVAVYFTFERNGTGQQILKSTAAFLRALDM